tara:strand:- start:727 stop:1080 length:354 start_codon:yes stop_codon:yes gene_type:complete
MLLQREFAKSFSHMDSSFYVWKEKTTGGHSNFLTGAGTLYYIILEYYIIVTLSSTSLLLDEMRYFTLLRICILILIGILILICAGGFLQNILYGYGGLRYVNATTMVLHPRLPADLG